ncbi:AAA family ATPase [Vibrio parahaemolyticus]|nr:AAA family ATPase [Vibrio parahaemolyticus]EKL9958196.1 AAA family ATPase [Vibrio parahaemolyticus]EKL9962862.1 AAA family ATPase [Vibrio parahaemolyticus]
MQIQEIQLNGKQYRLVGEDITSSYNTYTILTGKNGIGKSRLLKSICDTFLFSDTINNPYARNYNSSLANIKYLDYKKQHYINYPLSYGQKIEITHRTDTADYQYLVYFLQVERNFYISTVPACTPELEDAIIEFIKKGKNEHYYSYNLPFKENKYSSPIIAVTSSPFDKFPIVYNTENYFYRGARTLNVRSSRDDLDSISNKYVQLGSSFIKLFLDYGKSIKSVGRVFDFLELNHEFRISLALGDQFGITSNDIDNLYNKCQSIRFFQNSKEQRNINKTEEEITSLNEHLKEAYLRVIDYFNIGEEQSPLYNPKIAIDFNLDTNSRIEVLQDLITLVEYDLLNLDDILFSKANRQYGIKQASSGEVCILFTILAIAGEIEDNSLILIDEPELSLHPKWQEDFMETLHDAFSNFHDCHFIISTHSPNIIANLPETNSYILDMSTGNVVKGSNLKNRSSDYCMTHTFDVNNSNNEYLIRISLDLFFKLSKGEKLPSKSIEDIKYLQSIYDTIDESELKKVISSCIELWGMNERY